MTKLVLSVVLASALVGVGCGSDSGGTDSADATSLSKKLRGSWGTGDPQELDRGLVLEANGHYFKDETIIKNGFAVKDPTTMVRSSGTYKVTKSTLVLSQKEPFEAKTTYKYEYTAGHVLNGVAKPGGGMPMTPARLTITQQAAKGSNVAWPSIEYAMVDSWCTADADCEELADSKTVDPWEGPVECKANACVVKGTSDAVMLDESNNGNTVDVGVGQDVVVELASNPTTGYDWAVVSTDKTFGYPETEFVRGDDAVGSGGTTRMTWHTSGPLDLVGKHHVELAYRREFEANKPPADTFEFTANVTE